MHSINEKNKINNIIENSIKNIGGLIDVNTVIGSPIKGEAGEIIIPFSKVSFCILSGGGEYGKVSLFNKNTDLPCSVGNGTIVSIKPTGFLIKNANDKDFNIMSVSETSYEKFIEKATDFIKKMEN
jgi:sporulation protein YtfJ